MHLASDAYARLACGRLDPDEALVTGEDYVDDGVSHVIDMLFGEGFLRLYNRATNIHVTGYFGSG